MVIRAPDIATFMLALLVVGCTGGPVEVPVTVFDAGSDLDAGRDGGGVFDRDAGRDGGGVRDAGGDSGPRDGGRDAGGRDASNRDAGDRDAGDRDAGGLDASTPPSGWTPTLIDDSFVEGEQVDLVDIDGDNDLDVVVSLRETGTVRLHINGGNSSGGGTGTIWTPVNLATLGSIVAVSQAYVDLNNDQRLDVVAVGLYQPGAPFASPTRIAWYEQPTAVTGAWIEHIISDTGIYGVRALAIGDVSGDGLVDLVIGALPTDDENGQPTGDGLFWKRNLGNALFSDPIIIDNTLSAVEVIRVADIDRNGVDDVVASGRGSNVLAWYENMRPVGVAQDAPILVRHDLATITESNGFALGQLDADADLEVVVGYDDGAGGAVSAYDAPTDPRDPWSAMIIDPTLGGAIFETRVAIADLNQDGLNDVVAASRPNEALRAYTRTSTGGWIRQTVTSQLTGLIYVDTGDVDGDTYPDLITVTRGLQVTRDELTWWRTQP